MNHPHDQRPQIPGDQQQAETCPLHPSRTLRRHTLGSPEHHLLELHYTAHNCGHTARWELHADPQTLPLHEPLRGNGPCPINRIVRRAMRHANRDDLRNARNGNIAVTIVALLALAAAIAMQAPPIYHVFGVVIIGGSSIASAMAHQALARSSDPDDQP